MIHTDLIEVKTLLGIDQSDTREDTLLWLLVEMASKWIEELLDRPGLSKKSRTEIYTGSNTYKLLLRSRPVYKTPTIQVYFDQQAYFGATSGAFASTTELFYGIDFTLKTDSEDDTLSRSGILYRGSSIWPRRSTRQGGFLSPFFSDDLGSIKVIYTGGYTVDTLPAPFRLAVNLLIQRLRYIMPLGVELNSDNYEDRSIGIVVSEKDKLLTLIKPLIWSYRNWKF